VSRRPRRTPARFANIVDKPRKPKAGPGEALNVTLLKAYALRDQTEQLDQDMTPAEIVGALGRLKFADTEQF